MIAGALIGAGSSSVGYSVGAGDDWNVAAWAGSAIIGAGLGAASAGIGMKAGAAVSAATSGIQNLTRRSVVSIGAGIAAGALTDTTIGVLGTAAYNAFSGTELSTGLGGAVIGGLIGGGIGGGAAGGLAGLFKGIRKGANVNTISKRHFRDMPIYRGATWINDERNRGGAVGIWHIKTGEINLGYYTERPDLGVWGQPHAQQAKDIYSNRKIKRGGEYDRLRPLSNGIAVTRIRGGMPAIEQRVTYPNLRGFWIRKTGANSARVGFNSQALNGYQSGPGGGEGPAWLNSPQQRMQILTALRAAGIRPSIAAGNFTTDERNLVRLLQIF